MRPFLLVVIPEQPLLGCFNMVLKRCIDFHHFTIDQCHAAWLAKPNILILTSVLGIPIPFPAWYHFGQSIEPLSPLQDGPPADCISPP